MALIRILVDGYSLLHHWPELAPGRPRHSSFARDELVKWLTQYRDATGTPITIFFDGSRPRGDSIPVESTPEMEILYSHAGQTADQMIERAAHRLAAYGEVLVVTNDRAERDIVLGFGGMASSCGEFIHTMQDALGGLHRDLHHLNRIERNRYQKSR